MGKLLGIVCAVLCFVVLVKAHNTKPLAANSGSSLNAFSKFYRNCENAEDIFRCIKQQALKLVNRALNLQSIKVVDGVTLLQRDQQQSLNAQRKSADNDILQSESEIRSLSSDQLDTTLMNGIGKLLTNFQLQLNLPKVIDYAQNEVVEVEEGRKKTKKYLGPFLAAMAIKAGILKLAYHSIAIVAAKALIIGKIALVISAIIGLKKLVAPEGHEKTTYEIVKHPHVQQSHSYSSSHGEYDNHEGVGQYHRSFDQYDELMMRNPAFRNNLSPKYN
ncbi:uncharacterized protein LOC116341380 [Contarinia nasturtii]|uniref:uncharacterized protein LOC116341380 n=1 Tax=Contarinia nasturtii TaxID=265458 RepID=UPI0012D439AF|nr:uncharacterized protein LOC116341380 [Contarinia nasturtii]